MSLDQHTACTFIVSTVRFYMSIVSTVRTRPYRNRVNEGGHKDEIARLVETLAPGSVGKSTQKKLSSEVKHLGKREAGAGKRTVVAHAR